jgi:hypothetical protein
LTRAPVNFRSLLLGFAGVIFICTLTPYNDWAVFNTYFVGNYLPVGLLLVLITFIMLINGPLSRWRPKLAFSGGELAVSLGMMLVGCAVPGSGLMRYLPAVLVGTQHQANINSDYLRVLREVDLPQWVFPKLSSTDLAARTNDPVIANFWSRAPVEHDTFIDHFRAVPWRAWVQPAIVWGSVVAAIWGAVLCMAVIVRRQWVENERLPFPLAQVYLSLIEPPQPGHALNTLFRARGFWIAFAAVFIYHGLAAMHEYDPQHWPDVPVKYDLTRILVDAPFKFSEIELRSSQIFFSVIGVTFFLQTKIAFTLWAFYIASQIARMSYASSGGELTIGMQTDQQFGALLPFAMAVLWVGREQWKLVFRQMFFAPRPGEASGRYMPYRLAGWGFLACAFAIVIWLLCVGASVAGAIVIVTLMLLIMFVLARVVAETGLVFAQVGVPLWRPWVFITNELPVAIAQRTTLRSYFLSGWFTSIFSHDSREQLAVFSTHALRIADGAAYPNERNWRRAIPFTFALIASLALAYVVSGASMLYVEYTHAVTLDRYQQPVNQWGIEGAVKGWTLDPTNNYRPPGSGPNEIHNRVGHFAFGAALTTALSILRLRYEWWPLHPVGLLVAYAWPLKQIWFSIFLGWLVKILVVRFGGPKLFREARSFFIGMIIGETGAAAFWLIVSLVRSAAGLDYHAIRLLPA